MPRVIYIGIEAELQGSFVLAKNVSCKLPCQAPAP